MTEVRTGFSGDLFSGDVSEKDYLLTLTFCSSVDVKSEYKEMEKLHRSLREVAENALLRRGMQDFLLRMSPSKSGPPKTWI